MPAAAKAKGGGGGQAVSARQWAELLARRVPGVTGVVSVTRLTGGANSDVQWVRTYKMTLRRSKGPDTTHCLRRRMPLSTEENPVPLSVEAELMSLCSAAGVPSPAVDYVTTEADGVGQAVLTSWVPGEQLGWRVVRMKFNDGVNLAFECGRALGGIHSVKLAGTQAARVLPHTTPAQAARNYQKQYEAIMRREPWRPGLDYCFRWLGERCPPPPRAATLVHGDFRNGNFIVDETGIRAVVDWEVAQVGDPMQDLGWLCTSSWRFGVAEKPVGGFGSHADLFRGYESVRGAGSVDPARVEWWTVWGSVAWSVMTLTMLGKAWRAGKDRTMEQAWMARRASEGELDALSTVVPEATPLGAAPLPEILREGARAAGGGVGRTRSPSGAELLAGVQELLRDQLGSKADVQSQYFSRVATNMLAMAQRELRAGAALDSGEEARLRGLLRELRLPAPAGAGVAALRGELGRALRGGAAPLGNERLQAHLWRTAVEQVAIDQPKYWGLAIARRRAALHGKL